MRAGANTMNANTKSTSNTSNNVNGLFCKGYPIRYFIAVLILGLNVLNLVFGHPSLFLGNSIIVLLWYFVGWKKCYPITILFTQLLLTIVFMIFLFTFFKHIWSFLASNSNNT